MKALLFILTLLAIAACQSTGKKADNKPETVTETVISRSDDAVTFQMTVDGMTCTGCEQTITNALKQMEGIQQVTASHTDGMVMVTMNRQQPDTTAVKQKTQEAGYQVVALKQSAQP